MIIPESAIESWDHRNCNPSFTGTSEKKRNSPEQQLKSQGTPRVERFWEKLFLWFWSRLRSRLHSNKTGNCAPKLTFACNKSYSSRISLIILRVIFAVTTSWGSADAKIFPCVRISFMSSLKSCITCKNAFNTFHRIQMKLIHLLGTLPITDGNDFLQNIQSFHGDVVGAFEFSAEGADGQTWNLPAKLLKMVKFCLPSFDIVNKSGNSLQRRVLVVGRHS